MTRLTAAEYAALVERLEASFVPAAADPLAGLGSARLGLVVSCGDLPPGPPVPPDASPSPGAPTPYRIRQWTEGGDGWTALNDRLELDIHGAPAMTHVDTVSHFWRGERPTRAGDPLLDLARTGIVGRGVLIDLSRAPEGPAPLELALDELTRTDTELRPGDVLHLRFGRTARRPSDAVLGAHPTRGLSIEAAEWLAERRPSAIVTDEGLDPMPSEVDSVPVPWHVLVLTALRIPLVDGATLTELSATCEREKRFSFLSVIAPLPLPTASGSPVNPLALL